MECQCVNNESHSPCTRLCCHHTPEVVTLLPLLTSVHHGLNQCLQLAWLAVVESQTWPCASRHAQYVMNLHRVFYSGEFHTGKEQHKHTDKHTHTHILAENLLATVCHIWCFYKLCRFCWALWACSISLSFLLQGSCRDEINCFKWTKAPSALGLLFLKV